MYSKGDLLYDCMIQRLLCEGFEIYFLICLLWLKPSHILPHAEWAYAFVRARNSMRGSVKELYSSVEKCVQILISFSIQGGVIVGGNWSYIFLFLIVFYRHCCQTFPHFDSF